MLALGGAVLPRQTQGDYRAPYSSHLFGAILSPTFYDCTLVSRYCAPYSSQTIRGCLVAAFSLCHDSHPAFPAMRPHSLIVRLSCVKTSGAAGIEARYTKSLGEIGIAPTQEQVLFSVSVWRFEPHSLSTPLPNLNFMSKPFSPVLEFVTLSF